MIGQSRISWHGSVRVLPESVLSVEHDVTFISGLDPYDAFFQAFDKVVLREIDRADLKDGGVGHRPVVGFGEFFAVGHEHILGTEAGTVDAVSRIVEGHGSAALKRGPSPCFTVTLTTPSR